MQLAEGARRATVSDVRRLRDHTARRARDHFELWVVITCALTGVVRLLPLGAEPNDAVTRFLPAGAIVWYAGLTVAGVFSSVGLLWPARTLRGLGRALTLERVGVALLAGLLLGFGAALEVVMPRSVSGLILLSLGAACVGRVRQVNRELCTLVDSAALANRVICAEDHPPTD